MIREKSRYLENQGTDAEVSRSNAVVMGIGWIFIIDNRFKFNERLSNIIGLLV